MVSVSQALAERRSVRGFTDKPVDVALIRELALRAARAPSGGNLQPWHIAIVADEPLVRLKAIMADRIAEGAVEPMEYPVYPANLISPYRDRRFAVGEAMYGHIGIAREDKAERMQWFRRNFQFFGAPAALFCTVDKSMGPPQWSDLGMYLQSFMLLAIEAGLATCPQECWAVYPETIRGFLDTPADHMLFCGMAVGYEDVVEPANALRTERAPEGEWLRVVE